MVKFFRRATNYCMFNQKNGQQPEPWKIFEILVNLGQKSKVSSNLGQKSNVSSNFGQKSNVLSNFGQKSNVSTNFGQKAKILRISLWSKLPKHKKLFTCCNVLRSNNYPP